MSIHLGGRGFGHLSRVMGSGGAAPAPALPQAGALVFHLDADAIPAQANNTALTAWTDSVNGIAAGTPFVAPTYRTGGMGGKPYVNFSGAQLMTILAPGVLQATVNSLIYTIIVVARNIAGTQAFATLFGANTTGFNGPFMFGNASRVGVYLDSTASAPFSGSGICVLGDVSHATNQARRRFYINSTCFMEHTTTTTSSGSNVFGIGGRASNSAASKATYECYDIYVWNVALSPVEMIHAQKVICDEFSLAYPWTGIPKYLLVNGDSISVGRDGGAEFTYPYLTAASLGLGYGQWTVAAIAGASMAQLTALAPTEVDPIPALVGVPVVYSIFEWYNQGGSASSQVANSRAHLAARKAANPAMKIVFGTATATSGATANPAPRDFYCADFDADSTTDIDGYVPLHTAPNIGPHGVETNTTYFQGDTIHLKANAGTCGSRELHAAFLPAITAA